MTATMLNRVAELILAYEQAIMDQLSYGQDAELEANMVIRLQAIQVYLEERGSR